MVKYYTDPAAVYPLDNVFGVENPDSYECHVKRYDSRLSYLEIYSRKRDQTAVDDVFLSFAFSAVEYFEGTMTWLGANFQVAPPEACVQIARRLPYKNEMSERSILDFYILYVVETPHGPIKILAGSGGLVTVKE